MRPARLAALAAIPLLLVACSATAPTWTYAPAPSTTPVASASGSAGASGSPAASGSAAASGSPAASAGASGSPAASAGASGSPAASGGAGGETVTITASGIQFTTANVTAPAGKKFTLTFSNQDAGVPHDVDIQDANGGDVFKTDVFNGTADKSYDVGPLRAGTYPFVCNVHPNMKGTLTVQ